jgi:uncharacterized protein YkwD
VSQVPSLIVMALGLVMAISSYGAAGSSPFDLARNVRMQGCRGHSGTRAPLRNVYALNDAALELSHGVSLKKAVATSGYREEQSASLHVSGDTPALRTALSNQLCETLLSADFSDLGIAQHGRDTWMIFAVPFSPPSAANAGSVAGELLQRINVARAQARRCGGKLFPAAPPLQPNAMLHAAAEAHAHDMLDHNYFAHEGHDGSNPAERVAATGYAYRVTGENIASGPETAAQAVEGWIASPDHCENLMDARFVDSGVAFAASTSGPPRIYWVQEFATPR